MLIIVFMYVFVSMFVYVSVALFSLSLGRGRNVHSRKQCSVAGRTTYSITWNSFCLLLSHCMLCTFFSISNPLIFHMYMSFNFGISLQL